VSEYTRACTHGAQLRFYDDIKRTSAHFGIRSSEVIVMNVLKCVSLFVVLLVKSCTITLIESGGCTKSLHTPELEKSRLQHLKDSIIAQLGPYEPPRIDLPPLTYEQQKEREEVREKYLELTRQGRSQPETPKCLSEEFLAKPVTTFTGNIAPTEGNQNLPPILDAFCLLSC